MDALSIFTAVLGVAGLAGGAAGYFAKSRGDTIIALQGKEIEYWKSKAEELEKTNTKVTTERDNFKKENDKLWARAQGSPQMTKLTKAVNDLISYLKKNGK